MFRLVAGAAAFIAALMGGIGWYFSDQIVRPEPRTPLESGLVVTWVDDTTITLAGSALARVGRVWFLEWAGGFGAAGDVADSDRRHVTRRFRPLDGRPTAGSAVDLGAYLSDGDPRRAAGLAFEEVSIPGGFPAWFIPGARDTWVVFVHGMSASRGEALRALPAVAGQGFPTLVITYRNDPGVPGSKDGLSHLGATEWLDLEAAVRYAQGRGARRVVLFGFSMGGAIVADFLSRSELSHSVVGVVLDAPVLDWSATVRLAAQQRRVPGFITAIAQRAVSIRTGFRWDGPEGKVPPGVFRTPVLLFHGVADRKVPIGTSEALADALGGRVTFVRTAGAGHVQSWNFDPEGYERTLTEWLSRVAPGRR